MDEAENAQLGGGAGTEAPVDYGGDMGPTVGEAIEQSSEQTPLMQAPDSGAGAGTHESAEPTAEPHTASDADALKEPEDEVAHLSEQLAQTLGMHDSTDTDAELAKSAGSADAAGEPEPGPTIDATAAAPGAVDHSGNHPAEPVSADTQPYEPVATDEHAPAAADADPSQPAAEADEQGGSETVGATETELPASAAVESLGAIDTEPPAAVEAAEAAVASAEPAAASAEPPKRASVHSASGGNQEHRHEQPEQHNTVDSPPATAETAAVPEPAEDAAAEHAAAPGELTHRGKPHKETAKERLTEPTAMCMLKSLQETQGDKTEWHIATGVVYKGKKLNADEMTAMVDRLCVPKHGDDNMPPKPHAVKLVYVDNKEAYEPVKEVTKEDNINYMSELYSRCQETRSKTQQQLAEKYLQPLVKPKEKSSSPTRTASPKKAKADQPAA